MTATVRVDRDGPVLTLTIERPQVRNALDALPATVERYGLQYSEVHV